MSSASDKESGGNGQEASPLGRLVWFVVFAAAGSAVLAVGILLPEYAALVALKNRQAVLANQIRCGRDLVTYNDRLIQGAQEDGVLVARLMIRHGNYRPADMDPRNVPTSRPSVSVAQRLLKESLNPPPPPPNLPADVGRWIDHPGIKGGLVLLGMGMLVVGSILFGLDRRPIRTRGKTS